MVRELMTVAPAISIAAFIAEMPDSAKEKFFKIPPWITSTVIALFVGGVMQGVLGPLTAFITEILLTPILYILRHRWQKRKAKLAAASAE
jgi:hypothetical protein